MRNSLPSRLWISIAPSGWEPSPKPKPSSCDQASDPSFRRVRLTDGAATRWYHTGAPRSSRIIMKWPYGEPAEGNASSVRYQPGRATSFADTSSGGKSCGRQRIQYSSPGASAGPARTTTAAFSPIVNVAAVSCAGLGGATCPAGAIDTVAPSAAVARTVSELAPAAERTA